MSKIKDVIVYLDRVARERKVDLQERAVNRRSFGYDTFRFEYTANGSMVRLKIYDEGELEEVHTVEPDRIVQIWDNIEARKQSGLEAFRKPLRKIDPGLFGP